MGEDPTIRDVCELRPKQFRLVVLLLSCLCTKRHTTSGVTVVTDLGLEDKLNDSSPQASRTDDLGVSRSAVSLNVKQIDAADDFGCISVDGTLDNLKPGVHWPEEVGQFVPRAGDEAISPPRGFNQRASSRLLVAFGRSSRRLQI